MRDFTLPSYLPLILPSKLVSKRPDILAAEAELHASSAAIGIATANLFPNITLSASVAPTALTPSNLFQSSNLAWGVLAGVTTPVFHGGTLYAQKRASIDAYRASMAVYQQTVLNGLRQVADILRALGNDAEFVRADRSALDVAKGTLELTRDRLSAGRDNMLQLLNAERNYEQTRIAYVDACTKRYLDSAQLFVALGGGWTRDSTKSPQKKA